MGITLDKSTIWFAWAFVCMVACGIAAPLVFYQALFRNFEITIHMNNYNEFWFEFILVNVTFITGLVLFIGGLIHYGRSC